MSNITDQFLKVLNEALEADPKAVQTLIVNRTFCNEKLSSHPTIRVQVGNTPFGDAYSVGLLDIINGVLEPLTKKRIAVMFSESGDKILGFKRYDS